MARDRGAKDASSSEKSFKFSFPAGSTETLAGNRTITVAEVEAYNGFAFDPGGAGRNVVLPAEAHCKGVVLMISNKADAAEILTIQNDAPATIVTPTQNEAALIWCDGTAWFGLVGDQG